MKFKRLKILLILIFSSLALWYGIVKVLGEDPFDLFSPWNRIDSLGSTDHQNLSTPKTSHPLKIVASFFPLYDLTRIIVGDRGEVSSLIPAGVHLHDYEPSPQDWMTLQHADVFVVMGNNIGKYENKVIANLDRERVRLIFSARDVIFSNQVKKVAYDHSIDEGNASENSTSFDRANRWGSPIQNWGGRESKDPHIWTSLVLIQKVVENILAEMITIDPQHQNFYHDNGHQLLSDLKHLHTRYQKELAGCRQKYFLVHHNSYSYLAEDYDLQVLSIYGSTLSVDPVAKQIIAFIQTARELNINYIFFDSMMSPRTSKTIAKEFGAQVLFLHSLESWTDSRQTYLSLMRENLDNLKIGLEC